MIIAKIEPVDNERCFGKTDKELACCHALIVECMLDENDNFEDYCGAFGVFVPDGYRCEKCLLSEKKRP